MKTSLQRITRKTLLYKSGVEYADYGLNHVEGCTHGCTYPCYAMMMKKRCGKIKTYQDWIQPKIVENALDLLDKEIPRLKHKIKQVFLCFATDPFMYEVREVEELTLKILERLNKDKIKSTLISKGIYPSVLTNQSMFNNLNEYGSTIVSLSEDFRRRFEPFAAPIDLRIKALKKLSDAGLKTWVSMEPYPTPNIIGQDIRKILDEISFVDKIVFGKWNYNRQTSQFLLYKNFYNSMACEVINFCKKNSIEVHIKEGTINLGSLSNNQSSEKELLECYA
ncbi:MAG TPA: radical SAM protein [Candidatus Aquicultor sp.]|jgi:DNA repair photolyase